MPHRRTTVLLLACLALTAAGLAIAIACPPQTTAWSQPTPQNYARGLSNQPHVNLYLTRSGQFHGDYYDRDQMLKDGARDLGAIDFRIDNYEETTSKVPLWGEIVTRVQATVSRRLHRYEPSTTGRNPPDEAALIAFGTREAARQCEMPINLLAGAQSTPTPVDVIPTPTLRWLTALAAAALGLLTLTSLAITTTAKHLRTKRRTRAGLCPTCAYPRAPGAACPECGTTQHASSSAQRAV